jgi:hypothetical protein
VLEVGAWVGCWSKGLETRRTRWCPWCAISVLTTDPQCVYLMSSGYGGVGESRRGMERPRTEVRSRAAAGSLDAKALLPVGVR